MAPAPEGAVTVDDGEIHEHIWIRPAEAIRRRELGEIELIPPTWMTLFHLSDLPSVDAALAQAGAGEPQFYLSRIARTDDGVVVFWAGDAAYESGDVTAAGPRNRLLMLPDGWRVEQTA
jgi:hypothetical protein